MDQLQRSHRNPILTAVFYILLFTIYTYIIMITNTLIDVIVGQNRTSGNVIHYAVQFTLAAGFISFSLSRKLFPNLNARRILLIILSIIYIFGMIMFAVLSSSFLLSILSFFVNFAMGYIGGAVYYYMAAGLYQNRHSGLIMGSGGSLAILLQHLLQHFPQSNVPPITVSIICFLAIAYLIIRQPKDWMFEDYLPYSDDTSALRSSINRKLIYTIILVTIFIMSCSLIEISWVTANANFYSFPRLFTILGYLFIGITFDLFGRKFLHVFALCGLAFGFLCIYSPEYSTLRLCIFYFIIGIYVAYLNLGFWIIAPQTKQPELWASFGRTLTAVLEAIVGIVFLNVLGSETFLITFAMVILFITAIEFVVVDLLTQYKMDETERQMTTPTLDYLKKLSRIKTSAETALQNTETAKETEPLLTPEQQAALKFSHFTKKYEFTPRECDVLKEILISDDTMKIISERLNISERMLYRYMKNLYQKTGVENRAAIVKLYYESDH